MARLARIVLPGIPHHVTQRGNRRETTFFGDADYRCYRDLLAEAAEAAGTEIWAYCMMPNHVHVVAVPHGADGLRSTFAPVHRRYTARVNARNGWTGHLWQARFGSVAMDEGHLLAALRYVSLNPVRARLVRRAEDWPWSSVRAHLAGRDDALVRVAPGLERAGDFRTFLAAGFDEETVYGPLRRAESVGRPIGASAWLAAQEARLGRPMAPGKRGPKKKMERGGEEGGLFSALSP